MTKNIPPRIESPPVDLRDLINKRGPEARADFDAKLAVLQAARLVRESRAAANLSQKELALACGTTQSAISDIERGSGSQGPTVAVLARILHACSSRLQLEAALFAAPSSEQLAQTTLSQVQIDIDQFVERLIELLDQSPMKQAELPSASVASGDMIDLVKELERWNVTPSKQVSLEQVTGPNVAGYRVTVIEEDPMPEVLVPAAAD